MNIGTPTSLIQAIYNAQIEFEKHPQISIKPVIEAHIIDYLSQKFSIAMFKTKDDQVIKDLWFQITGRHIK